MRGLNVLRRHWKHWGMKGTVAVGFAALVVVLMLWLSGRLSPKIRSAARPEPAPTTAAPPATATAVLVRLPTTEMERGHASTACPCANSSKGGSSVCSRACG